MAAGESHTSSILLVFCVVSTLPVLANVSSLRWCTSIASFRAIQPSSSILSTFTVSSSHPSCSPQNSSMTNTSTTVCGKH
jgi:hypothetical protein